MLPTKPKIDILSNISVPIALKADIEDFEIEIEDILASNFRKK